MSDPRKNIFDKVRPKLGTLTARDVQVIHAVLDVLNYESASPPPPSKTSQAGIDLIHSFETLKLTAYKDPGSHNGLPITNGWGTTVDEDGGPITLGEVWTKEKADRLFIRDIAKFEAKLDALLGAAPTSQPQYDALMSFGYNVGMGEGGLKTSTLLRLHKEGDYAGAKAQFARWNKNDGKVLKGLVRRRAAEAALYAS